MTAAAAELDMRDRHCPTAPRRVHVVDLEARFDHGLRGACRHCGATVHRAERGSRDWWHDWAKNETRPTR